MKPIILQLKCFPYPEYKPPFEGVYIVEHDQDTLFSYKISTLSWVCDGWVFDGDKVIAWAEMPESLVE